MSRLLFVFMLSAIILSGCNLAQLASQAEPPTAAVPLEASSDSPTEITPLPVLTVTPPLDQPGAPNEKFMSLAYLGWDGNILTKRTASGIAQNITTDASNPFRGGSGDLVQYSDLSWSSDGRYLAFLRTYGKPVSSGLEMSYDLQVHDTETGQTRTLLPGQQTLGIDWKPGTHLLAYALPIDPGYFTARGQVDATLAKGIWGVDVDGGEPVELVKPTNGLTLVRPEWSKDGRFLSFEEVFLMEGRGKFGLYDFNTGQTLIWEGQPGNIAWTPDHRIVFDTLTYTPSGMERIWIANWDAAGSLRISPHYGEGFAIYPVISPKGNQVAYMAKIGAEMQADQEKYKIFVQPLEETNEPTELGEFEQPLNLAWTSDGSALVFSAGPYEQQQIILLYLDGSINVIADGSMPAWRP